MNIKKFISNLVLFITIFLVGVCTGIYGPRLMQSDIQTQNPSNTTNVRQVQAHSEVSPPSPTIAVYLVKIDNGKVGVFKYDNSGNAALQYYSEQINVNSLREQDKERLTEGITVQSNDELAALIEDFSS